VPRVHVTQQLFVLWRKASTNNHNTSLAGPHLFLDTPDWQHPVTLILVIRLRDTCTLESARQHIHTRQHAGASTTTTSPAAAYAWRRWWYVYSLHFIITAATNAM
jgi:hypothetical protein